MTAFARALAQARPAEIALDDGRSQTGWAELDDKLNRVANGLLGLDLGPERRVSVFAENASETAIAHIGGLIAGASTVPCNFHLTAPELAYILSDSGSTVLFVGPETVDRGIEAAAEAGVELVIGWRCGDRAGVVDWDGWLRRSAAGDPPTDMVPRPHLLYTSGTTGRPKGTDLPPTMFAGGATIAEHLELLKRNRFADFATHMVVGPMYHTGPLSGARLLAAGKPSVILGRFDPEATLAAIERHRVETSVMVPTHFVRLLALPEEVRSRYDVSSLKLITHTGAKCPVEVKRAMIDWWGPVFLEAYGASEVGTTNSINSEEWLAHPGSVGRTLPPFEAVILDDRDQPAPPGVEGRLFFKDTTGRGIIYHNDPAKTAAAHIAPGVFSLGEIAYMDEDGYVYITDRFSDMVVSGGVNIYPAESENVLIQHPEVADVACIGVPHAEMGEELKALVVPRDPAHPPSEAELLQFCRDRLTHYKCPRSVDFVETVGRTTMSKVNKRALRAPYWERSTSV
ncbi:MAG TPA: AMP-binding protein [Acidimicrobiales bacterium]|nr:AMP-binding protein [Acidimicrobiales bacterium]